MQAYNPETGQYYLWISDLQWQTTQRASKAVDLKEDALEIWNIFDLKSYELIELSHVHRDFYKFNNMKDDQGHPFLLLKYFISHPAVTENFA